MSSLKEQVSENRPVQLGLCCMNMTLKEQKPPVYASRKIIVRIIDQKGIEELKHRVILNLKDLLKMLDWNEQNGIKVFRLSSELFPHKTNPKVPDYDIDFAQELLEQIGEKARGYNQRLTFHPGQYKVIGSPNDKSFKQTIRDLKYHADVLDLMDMDKNSVIVIHGGGVYGNKVETLDRWCLQFKQLPDNVQKRLVLENCEKCFSIEDCLYVSEKINIPVVLFSSHSPGVAET